MKTKFFAIIRNKWNECYPGFGRFETDNSEVIVFLWWEIWYRKIED